MLQQRNSSGRGRRDDNDEDHDLINIVNNIQHWASLVFIIHFWTEFKTELIYR